MKGRGKMSANKELLKVSVYLNPEDLLDPKFITSEDDLLSIAINELYASSEYYDDTLFTYTEIDEDTRNLFFDVFLKELKENELDYNKNGYGNVFDILDLKIDTMNFIQTEDDCLEYIFPVEIDFDAMKEWLQEKGLMEEQKPHFAYDIDYAYDDDEIDDQIQNLDNDRIQELFDIDAAEYEDGNELLSDIRECLYHEPALYDELFDVETRLEIPKEVWETAIEDGDYQAITDYISDTTGFLVNDYKVDEELEKQIKESKENIER